MGDAARVLNVVALTADMPERGLVRGQVGTVVEKLADDTFEVEFVDEAGHTYAQCAISTNHLLVLHYKPSRVA